MAFIIELKAKQLTANTLSVHCVTVRLPLSSFRGNSLQPHIIIIFWYCIQVFPHFLPKIIIIIIWRMKNCKKIFFQSNNQIASDLLRKKDSLCFCQGLQIFMMLGSCCCCCCCQSVMVMMIMIEVIYLESNSIRCSVSQMLERCWVEFSSLKMRWMQNIC